VRTPATVGRLIINYNLIARQKLSHLYQNPVEAGFVKEILEYLYSSAKDYQ